MIIVLKPHPAPEVVEHVLERIAALGLTPHLSQGVSRTIIGVIGDEAKLQVQPLQAIPGVEQFELLRQVSPENGYRFGISMEFADRRAYDGYNGHPDHVRFVEERWLAEVSDFLELDYVEMI